MLSRILPVVLWLIVIVIDLVIDEDRLKKGKTINHTLESIPRFFIAGLMILWVELEGAYEWWTFLSWMFFTFWFFFDLGLNLLMGWAYNYVGETAMIDKFIRKITKGTPVGIHMVFMLKLFAVIFWTSMLVYEHDTTFTEFINRIVG